MSNTEIKTERLPIESIKADQQFQLRVGGINPDVREDYEEFLRSGVELPPLVVYRDEGTYRLVDGFHRLSALQGIGAEHAVCEVRAGDEQAALDYTLFEANRTNGVRLTRADQRNLVRRAVEDERFREMPSNTLAEKLGVAPKTVRKTREELGLSLPSMRWYDQEPPAGADTPEHGGYPVLTQKVALRLADRLGELEASLTKLEPLSEWLEADEAQMLAGLGERVVALAEEAL